MTPLPTENSTPEKIIRVRPESASQIADVIRTVADKQVLLMPRGAESRDLQCDNGNRQLLFLSLDRLGEVVKLAEADFYIRCQTGVRLAELSLLLESHSLHFPFLTHESPGTVGGMVASGQIGNSKGTFRISRWVLAVDTVMADGNTARTGAVTFKSVAGYDLPKLFCGSFGTLGVITEVALRLYPVGSTPFGKDMKPAAARTPHLASEFSAEPVSAAERIARKIKHSLDPHGIFPVIAGWNKPEVIR